MEDSRKDWRINVKSAELQGKNHLGWCCCLKETRSLYTLCDERFADTWPLIWASWTSYSKQQPTLFSGGFFMILGCLCGNILPLYKIAYLWSGTDNGWEDLAHNQLSNSSQQCSVGLRSGLDAGHLSSITPNLSNHVFVEMTLWIGAQACWNRKRPQLVPTLPIPLHGYVP